MTTIEGFGYHLAPPNAAPYMDVTLDDPLPATGRAIVTTVNGVGQGVGVDFAYLVTPPPDLQLPQGWLDVALTVFETTSYPTTIRARSTVNVTGATPWLTDDHYDQQPATLGQHTFIHKPAWGPYYWLDSFYIGVGIGSFRLSHIQGGYAGATIKFRITGLTWITTTGQTIIYDEEDETRQTWNVVAHAMGIEDLFPPPAPFNYGEAGELLFCVCARLWRMGIDPALPDPVGTDPADWRTFIETGVWPA